MLWVLNIAARQAISVFTYQPHFMEAKYLQAGETFEKCIDKTSGVGQGLSARQGHQKAKSVHSNTNKRLAQQ